MAGSMREKQPGVWELRVFLGRDARGRVRHLSRTHRGPKRAAQRELARLVSSVDGSQDAAPPMEPGAALPLEWGDATTVNDAIRGWQLNGWDDLSPTTTRRYASLWRVHIRDTIGPRRIADLGPYEVEQWLRQLKRSGLGEASVHQARAMLHRACRLARKWSSNRLANPIADTEMPEWSYEEGRDEVRAPTVEEVQALLAAAREWEPRIGTYVRVVAATGARRAEVAALRWDDVDLDRRSVRIDEGAVVVEGGTAVKRPKTKKSVRVLAVDEATMGELGDLLGAQERVSVACGVALGQRSFVFALDPLATTPPYLDTFSSVFAKVRRAAGVASDVHLHSLRHFQSTQLDAVISEAQKQARLGWTTVQMARHYTDTVTEEDRRAAEHIGSVLGGAVAVSSKA